MVSLVGSETILSGFLHADSGELSDDEGDDDLEGENENYICTLLDEDGWECGQRWPTARALAAHQRHTQTGTHGENQREWQAWWSQISASGAVRHMPVLRQHPNTWQQQKDTTDAWLMLVGFTILSSIFLLTPSALVVISSLTTKAELQRHLASTEYPPPEGHSLVINAETSVSASGSDLLQKIRDRWRARRAERETKTHTKSQPGGTKDDVAMGGTSSGQKGSAKGANKSTDAKLHNAVLKTLCVLCQQVREVRGAVFMCWMIKQEAPEYKKPKEQLRAYSELAATEGKGHGLGPPGIAAFTGLLQALSERGSTVGAANAAGVANLKQTWDDMEPEGAFDLVPHCKLATVYDPALSRLELVISVAQHREHIRGALGQTGANRLLGQAPSGALERALSAAIEQN